MLESNKIVENPVEFDNCSSTNIPKSLIFAQKAARRAFYYEFIVQRTKPWYRYHDKGIVYRDLKPENVILDPDGHIRLADFGLSKYLNPDDLTHSFCGSAEYMAPEMLTKSGHNYAIDFYCLGALLF